MEELTMDELLLQQKNTGDLIKNFMSNTNKVGKENQTIGFLQGRIQLLNKYWNKFEKHNDIIILSPSDDKAANYFKKDTYSEIEIIFANTIGKLNDLILALNAVPQVIADLPNPDQQQQRGNFRVKLPAIALPKFSGDFNEWTSFHDLFDSLVVKNPSLTNVDKLYHLKSKLSGEAELVLRQFAIEENNFVPAWTLLKRRFANKRMLVNAQFSKLLSQSKINSSNPDAVRHILDTSTESINALKAQLKEEERFDSLLVYILTQKLDMKTIELWEQSINTNDNFQTFEAFSTFLENHCRTQELVQSTASTSKIFDTKKPEHHRIAKSFHTTKQITNCVVCNKSNHSVFRCFRFKKLSVQERWNVVKSKNLCVRCLSPQHKSADCPHTYECFQCKEQHNVLLHKSEVNLPKANPFQSSASSQNQPSTSKSTVYSHYGTNRNQSQTLLATAQVNIESSCGKVLRFRALVDPGSQACLITRSAANLLNLNIIKCNTTVKGLGSTTAGESSHVVSCIVGSIHNTNSAFAIEAVVMPKLTDMLPAKYISVSHNWTHLQNLQLADPAYFKPEKIDLILGADVYGDLMIPEIRKGPSGAPLAQKSSLGWILIGKLFNESNQPTRSREVVSYFTSASVCDQLRKFWELEEVTEERKPTKEEEMSESHFQQTHIRTLDGRYSVDLPFNTTNQLPPVFGNSRNQAFVRLCQVEKRLQTNPDLKKQYCEFMHEYIRLGHMHPINNSSAVSSFYLPHHAIIKPSSVSTKLRVVFDGSAKDSNGTALNDTFRIGPTIQQDLLSILLRWRRYRVAITADVEKMYRQISVNQHHQPYQRILWRNEEGKITDYELDTVTYGTACAPYLAIRTIRQLAMDEQAQFPDACARTITDMYVDDFISGGDSIDETLKLHREMVELFKRGGFNLRKWSSNSSQLLDNIPSANREVSTCLDVCRDDIVKTLGVTWNTADDDFRFVVNTSEKPIKLTKRTLLSDLAKLFDPVGFLAPVVINAKILFQSLWLKGLEWDEPLPEDISNEWLSLRTNLNLVAAIRIPRWIGMSRCAQKVEYHGFCDASNKAYAAVVFSRTEGNGKFEVHLLTSKTRVAPVKRVSLPNLELCGATLLANLMRKVQHTMGIDAQLFAWTDSTIVLDWIKSNTHKQTFVANRVSTILDNLKPSQWRHVRSKENPADVASRGICPKQLQNHTLWWHGPTWLQKPMHEWPTTYKFEKDISSIIEVHTNTIPNSDNDFNSVIERFSTIDHLVRVTARCLQFARKCSPLSRPTNNETTLTADDLRSARNKLLQFVQHQHYSADITMLKQSKSLGTSKISALHPFICNAGFIRVGGRLRNADISYDHKHPILLPYNNHVTKLIILKIHYETLHGGLKLMLATLRQNFWVSNARTSIRAIIHRCIQCRRHSTNVRQQLMSALPAPRVQQSRVFAHTGVDYAGPFDLRLSKHRGRGTYKGFVAVFVCMSTKAIHLELASDLSTITFIAAYKRFVARRGKCSDIYSDNGTNFVGAKRDMQSKFDETMQEITAKAAEFMANEGTTWHFIPASSPHFGGLWEAGVKSFKHHLRRILDNTTLTYEEFNTLLNEIEANLNSRPLCPLSSDPNDMEALTPGHFLVGGPLNANPEPSLLSIPENRLDRWQYMEKLNQDFWKSWSRDYLSELQQRPKGWRQEQPNLQEGDIVVVKDIRLPPSNWPLARVTAIHPGDDGIVRAVTVKHKNGVTKRAINKLCRLPVN